MIGFSWFDVPNFYQAQQRLMEGKSICFEIVILFLLRNVQNAKETKWLSCRWLNKHFVCLASISINPSICLLKYKILELFVKKDIINAFLVAMLLSNVPRLIKISGDILIYQVPLHLPNFPSAKRVTKQHFPEQILLKVGSLGASNAIETSFSIMSMVQENADNVRLMCVHSALVQLYLSLHNLRIVKIW